METYDTIRELISSETIKDNIDVRNSFLERYSSQTDEFINNMSQAFIAWRSLDSKTKNKLFLSGYIVASGNIERQAIETISLAILFSNKHVDIFNRYIQNKYSTNKAVRDLKRHSKGMTVSKDGLDKIERAHKYFHDYSHPSYITIGSNISFQGQGMYLGASFDEGKVDFYDKDISGRLSLSAVFTNYITAVESAVSKW